MDLDTADDAPAGILSALSSALCPDTLQVFHCRWRYWDECTAVGSFLRNAGRSITDLTLNMSAASWVEEAGGAIQREGWVRLNLASCPNVRTFRTSVRLPLACPSSDVVNVRLAVASYRNLFSLLPHAVCTVVIHMSHVQRSFDHTRLHRAMRQDAARGLISVDFSEIEEALLELPRLERVILFMRGSEIVRQGGPGAVANAFPGLHAAGILHIRSGAASPSVSLW
ncbi:hypothetical protein C8Q73DRAFT_316439 [Cubamyces lactineus]|nr:hypothetical protein C8Q73DRAFT_316439 [Cubamyces lactineus]